MNTEQIINYVTETPTNTNRAVLRSMLQDLIDSGFNIYICNSGEYDESEVPIIDNPNKKTIYLVPGGEENNNLYKEYIWTGEEWELFGSYDIDLGYKVTRSENVIFEDSVIVKTSYNGAYKSAAPVISSNHITTNTLKIVFDGVEYKVTKGEFNSCRYYGGAFQGYFNFGDYPFSLAELGVNTGFVLGAKTPGTYNLKVIAVTESYTLSEDLQFVLESIKIKNLIDGSAIGSIRGVGTAEEDSNYTMGDFAFAEGRGTKASGDLSHAEGYDTTASGSYAHAEGAGGTASSAFSHVEGGNGHATAAYSHAEGDGTTASGTRSHSEGFTTTASGANSHAEGRNTKASGESSHAEGYYTTASHKAQHVFGEYNVLDPSTNESTNRGTYVEIVGKGTANGARSNARTLDWSGNEVLAGKLTVGAAPTADMDVATKKYVDDSICYIYFDRSGGNNSTVTINKTFAEVDAAYNAQKYICGRSATSSLININKSFHGGKQMQMYEFYLAYVQYTTAPSLKINKVTLYSDNTIETADLGTIS